jgi:hypothetical protein
VLALAVAPGAVAAEVAGGASGLPRAQPLSPATSNNRDNDLVISLVYAEA